MSDEIFYKYDRITKLLETMTKFKEPLLSMHEVFKGDYLKNPSSCTRHHAWEGGYLDHVYEVMEISLRLYGMVTNDLKASVTFDREDVTLISYIHDINKLNRYRKTQESWKLRKGIKFEIAPGTGNCDESAEVVNVCARFGLVLEHKHLEALSHHHGGFSDSMCAAYKYPGSLTSFSSLIHSADLLSQYLFGIKE